MGPIRTWRGVLVAAGVAAVVALGGCATKDPNKPLTVDEGEKLLKDVRSDKARVQDLTPAEKRYLKQTLAK